MLIKICAAIVLAFTLLLAPTAQAQQKMAVGNPIIGTILSVEGGANVISKTQGTKAATVNMMIHKGDVITTGTGARAYVMLIDNTELTLSENSQLDVSDYVFDEQDTSKNKAVYNIAEGAFLYVSGLVAKKENPDVTVNIPQGSIGIRGTKFWGGESDGVYGIVVGEGAVEVKTKAGAVKLAKGQGTNLRWNKAPEAPSVWSKSRLDAAIKTISLKDPEAVGQRIKQNEAIRQQLRLRLKQAQDMSDATTDATTETTDNTTDTKTAREKLKEALANSDNTTTKSSTETPVKDAIKETVKAAIIDKASAVKELSAGTVSVAEPVTTTVKETTTTTVAEPVATTVKDTTSATVSAVKTGVASTLSTTKKVLTLKKDE